MIFSIILDIAGNSLHIPKGQCIGREALCVPMYSGNKAILLAMTPQCFEHFCPNSMQEQERGAANLQTLMVIGHFGMHSFLLLVPVGHGVSSELTGVGQAHNLTHQEHIQLCLGQSSTPGSQLVVLVLTSKIAFGIGCKLVIF